MESLAARCALFLSVLLHSVDGEGGEDCPAGVHSLAREGGLVVEPRGNYPAASLIQAGLSRSWLVADEVALRPPAAVPPESGTKLKAGRAQEWVKHLDGLIRHADSASTSEFLFELSGQRSAEKASASATKHPFWVFQVDLIPHWSVLGCVAALFFAGLLCSAGGIGGGGIYVTVLMVAGQMSVSDAVPLSKAVVFLGSISSLVLNAKKQFVCAKKGEAQALIDYNVCRLVVPCSLIGTYLGVLFNRWLPGWIILSVLTIILLGMTISIVRTTVIQYWEEQDMSAPERAPEVPTPRPADAAAASAADGVDEYEEACDVQGNVVRGAHHHEPHKFDRLRDTLSSVDVAVAITLLCVVVAFSVLRYHAGQCREAPAAQKSAVCHHPAVFWVGGALQYWMSNDSEGTFITVAAFLLPLTFCVAVALYSAQMLVSHEGWSCGGACKFAGMAVTTGCLAGLVGIGGGLIFSPFFLLMGLEPSIAVATSSTCVIFTSSSTTLQYVLTDRVIVSLAFVYGLTNLVASYVGTRFVHFLQDAHLTRRSMISGIVALGVLISTALAVIRLVEGIMDGFKADVH